MAIAAFERTLISVNEPYDRFLKGDRKALTEDAMKGLEIFNGKATCAACHDGVNICDDKFYALHVPENPVLLNDPRVTATMRLGVPEPHEECDMKELQNPEYMLLRALFRLLYALTSQPHPRYPYPDRPG